MNKMMETILKEKIEKRMGENESLLRNILKVSYASNGSNWTHFKTAANNYNSYEVPFTKIFSYCKITSSEIAAMGPVIASDEVESKLFKMMKRQENKIFHQIIEHVQNERYATELNTDYLNSCLRSNFKPKILLLNSNSKNFLNIANYEKYLNIVLTNELNEMHAVIAGEKEMNGNLIICKSNLIMQEDNDIVNFCYVQKIVVHVPNIMNFCKIKNRENNRFIRKN